MIKKICFDNLRQFLIVFNLVIIFVLGLGVGPACGGTGEKEETSPGAGIQAEVKLFCEKLSSEGEKQSCLKVSTDCTFDPVALLACEKFNSDEEKVDCIRVIKNKFFNPAALLTCDGSSTFHSRLNCVLNASAVPSDFIPEKNVYISNNNNFETIEAPQVQPLIPVEQPPVVQQTIGNFPNPEEIALNYEFGKVFTYNGANIFVSGFPRQDQRLKIDVWKASSCSTVSQQAAMNPNALAVINGGFFNGDFSPNSIIKASNGYINNDPWLHGGLGIKFTQPMTLDFLVVNGSGSADPYDRFREAGPIVLDNYQVIDRNSCIAREGKGLCGASFFSSNHPRTGVCANGEYIYFIVVDGRSQISSGIDLENFGRFMKDVLYCQSGMNFDGGGSSAMWVKNLGVVNSPSDGHERCVSDGLMITY